MMSNSKAVPDGLKDQECKKGSRAKRPPILYVPVVNPVQDHFFSLYANLLSKDARFQWDKIVMSQVDSAP